MFILDITKIQMGSNKYENNPQFIDRKTAAKLLSVSTRTLDRYLRKEVLTSVKEDHRIYIPKEEIDEYVNRYNVDSYNDVDEVDVTYSSNNYAEDTSENVFQSVANNSAPMVSSVDGGHQVQVYKNLYYEFKEDLDSKIERLETANYKIGELEERMKNMIPEKELAQKTIQHKDESQNLKLNISQLTAENVALKSQIKQERVNKVVYIALLSGLVIAVPVIAFLSLSGII